MAIAITLRIVHCIRSNVLRERAALHAARSLKTLQVNLQVISMTGCDRNLSHSRKIVEVSAGSLLFSTDRGEACDQYGLHIDTAFRKISLSEADAINLNRG
jgi:hypothetical protein